MTAATMIKLVRLNDMASDIDSLDLMAGLSSATGIVLARDGWVQQVAADGDASVDEVFTLRIKGTSTDDLATKIQALDAKIRQVRDWVENNTIERYQVWLRVQMYGETNERQAMVLAIRGKEVAVQSVEAQLNSDIEEYVLTVTRTPWWEDPYAYPTTTALSGINCLGGMAQLSETIYGDVNARLIRLVASPHTGGSKFNTLWLGWKTDRFGNAAYFVPTWGLGLATISGMPDVELAVDASSYSITRLTCTFATTPTIAARATISADQVSAYPNAQRGTYTVLLRAMMSDTSVAKVRLSSEPFGNRVGSKQVINSANWHLYEMGTFSLPSVPLLPAYGLDNCGFTLEAELVSGTGHLYLDCLILIPEDDGVVKMVLADPYRGSDPTYHFNIFQKADDRVTAMFDMVGVLATQLATQPKRWCLPARDAKPYLVVASATYTDLYNDKNFSVDVSYTYTTRWRTLRGSKS